MSVVPAGIIWDGKNQAWFTANATEVFDANITIYCNEAPNYGQYKFTDGVTALSALPWMAGTPSGVLVTGDIGVTVQGYDANTTILGNSTTGTGAIVRATSPTFGTDITTPLIRGVGGFIQTFSTDLVNIGNKVTTSQRMLRVGQDTAWIDIGSYVTNGTNVGIYGNATTPSDTNFALRIDNAANLFLNCASSAGVIRIQAAGITNTNFFNTYSEFIPRPVTSGAINNFNFIASINTNQTLGTNIPNFRSVGSVKTWQTGALPLQYFNHFTANTVAFAGASTATNVYNLFVDAPTAGANATITNNYAAGFNGGIHQENNGTNGIKFIPLVGDATYSAIYMNKATPSGTNYTLTSGANDTYLRGVTSLALVCGSTAMQISTTYIANIYKTYIGANISPSAYLHIAAGSAAAATAPIKLTAGTNMTTAETGAIEYNNTFHLTNSDAIRRHIVLAPNTTKVTAAAPYANDGYIVVNIGGTDFKLMTTA
jgi:hypothetical protein